MPAVAPVMMIVLPEQSIGSYRILQHAPPIIVTFRDNKTLESLCKIQRYTYKDGLTAEMTRTRAKKGKAFPPLTIVAP